MPPVAEFDLRKPVSKWMEERHRRPRGKDSGKYKNNEFFTGFFSCVSENTKLLKASLNPLKAF